MPHSKKALYAYLDMDMDVERGCTGVVGVVCELCVQKLGNARTGEFEYKYSWNADGQIYAHYSLKRKCIGRNCSMLVLYMGAPVV